MGKFGYDFYFKIGEEVLTLPITPSSLRMTIGSNNKVVTLINEGDINILKSPSLVEFEFDARFPMRKYPYSREALNFETYLNKFTALKTDKKPFVFNVVRTTPDGKGTWATVRRVTLEDLEINEDADEGDDVIVSFTLKEYKEYGVKTLKSPASKPTTTSTSEKPRSTDNKAREQVTYTVRAGDCLWSIAKWAYNDGSKQTAIYEANKTVIEETAKKYGRKSSSNGHWIYVGTVLVLPDLEKLPTSTQSYGSAKKKVTLNIMNMGNKEYWGTYDVYVNNSYRRGGNASNYTTTLTSGDTVRIAPRSVKGHGYTVSSSSFTITKDTIVTINWVR